MPAHHRSSAVAEPEPRQLGRRKFLGFLVAAPTLAVAVGTGVDSLFAEPALAALPTTPSASEAYDLSDALTDSALPTSNLISIVVNSDGTVTFDLPRAECGQGITTAVAMIIAEEMDLPVEKVNVTLANARPELVFNQLTGGSNTIHAMYTPIRMAAALAKGKLLEAAAALLDEQVTRLKSKQGMILAPLGAALSYGELSTLAASPLTKPVELPELKPESEFTVIGKRQGRIDARDIVTGKKKFAIDLDVPDAKPTMVHRAPTIGATPKAVSNQAEVLAMPGITDIAVIKTGVAVRGETFGQVIDAVRALEVSWSGGPVEAEDDASIEKKLDAAVLPLLPAAPGAKEITTKYTFAFRSGSPLETNTAIANVQGGKAEIWTSAKSPIVCQAEVSQLLGIPQTAVTVHVTQGGGSFGRHLFHDAALEAAEASKKMGKPVRLMWHRADDSRHGRAHPMCTSTVRAAYTGDTVVSFQQNHTSVETDFGHGFGEAITNAVVNNVPLANLSVAEIIFLLAGGVNYNFGVTSQLLMEVPLKFNTSAVRNVYSPDVRTAMELTIDQLAAAMGKDPFEFRRAFVKTDTQRRTLEKAAEAADWGKSLPAGVAQGIGMHTEYKGTVAVVTEIDCRPETVNRQVRDGVTGPRVTKATIVVTPGKLCINPRGMEAQLAGGFMDAMAYTLTGGLHIKNGIPLEASWDNYFYTRQWNVPPELEVIIADPDPNGEVPGAGELGVAPACGSIACAYGRATGTVPTYFPIHHREPLAFEPKPLVPPVPESPVNGLDYTY